MNLINLMRLYDNSLFNDIVYPSGLDKDTLINSILDQCAMYDCLYDEETLLKLKIQYFFKRNELTYERLYEAYTITYNILDNTDRNHSETITYTREREASGNNSNKDINKVSPMDSGSFLNDSQTETTGSDKENEKITESTTTTSRDRGNIGVTSSQQMLESELNIRPKLNIYEVIARDFFNEFVLHCL